MSILQKFLPQRSVAPIEALLEKHKVSLSIVPNRKTRHGDYRRLPNGQHKITMNSGLNPYSFLITLVHELAHLVAFEYYGRRIKPHGPEWKNTFAQMMQPFINERFFPADLVPVLQHHFTNPSASSDTDPQLAIALKKYNDPNGKHLIRDLSIGDTFGLDNGRSFKVLKKLRKRTQCQSLSDGRLFVFQPHAEVVLLKSSLTQLNRPSRPPSNRRRISELMVGQVFAKEEGGECYELIQVNHKTAEYASLHHLGKLYKGSAEQAVCQVSREKATQLKELHRRTLKEKGLHYICYIPMGGVVENMSGDVLKVIKPMRKNILCTQLPGREQFLVHPKVLVKQKS